MAAEITKVYQQMVPAMRFIGKKYGDEDRVNGSFGAKWGEWFENGWFEKIEAAAGGVEACAKLCEDGDAYIGLMRACDGDPFQYWVGMFTPAGTVVPDGYDYLDFPARTLGVAWIYGPEWELYGREQECLDAMEKNGIHGIQDDLGAWWCMERYACPRFTTQDEKGNVTLDICFYTKL